MIRARLAFAAGALALASAAAGAGEELERVVAVVRSAASPEPHVLTRSRIEEEARIALVARGATLAATGPLDAEAMRAGLDWLVDQTLLADEATRLRVFDIDAADSRAELERFRARFPRDADYRAFLRRLDLAEAELEAVLRRGLRVSRYVESRVSHAAQVPEADVSAWLEQNAAALGTRDRDAARAHLAAERVREETTALLRDVRARADVRVLSGPDGGRG